MAKKIEIEDFDLANFNYHKSSRQSKPIICHILIVCEGEKTEPQYFKSFNKTNNGNVIYELTIDGGRINTKDVVKKAIEMRDKSDIKFDQVWAVFDKDDFPTKDFNGAINMAKAHNVNCAWSNQAFELWYLLHFHNRITSMEREEYKHAISVAVNGSLKYKKKKPYVYKKNAIDNFEVMNTHGSQNNAINWAKNGEDVFFDTKYANHNPCTTVYKLVKQLIGKDEDLNLELKRKVNG